MLAKRLINYGPLQLEWCETGPFRTLTRLEYSPVKVSCQISTTDNTTRYHNGKQSSMASCCCVRRCKHIVDMITRSENYRKAAIVLIPVYERLGATDGYNKIRKVHGIKSYGIFSSNTW